MTSAQRGEIERALLGERERTSETLRRLDAGLVDGLHDRGRPGDDRNSSGAGGGAEDDQAVVVRNTRALEEIDGALSRLRLDPLRFGICEACGKAIPMERLRFVPGTRHCQLHAPE